MPAPVNLILLRCDIMEADGDNTVWFTYTEQEDIPLDATHIFVSVKVILRLAFRGHPNIVAVHCHDNVEKIEEWAFARCPRLRLVIMPGVKIVEQDAFNDCEALAVVICGKLEIIGEGAFRYCESLRSINLPSARIVKGVAFSYCRVLKEANFGNKLERIEEAALLRCLSLERITIPLKDNIITADDIFAECEEFNHVDLIEGALHETIAALHFEEWRTDMRGEIDSINQILPITDDGGEYDYDIEDYSGGEKALAIRTWIRSLLRKIIRYKEKHQAFLIEEVATALDLNLPAEIVMNNVISFLELPPHTFEDNDE